jgi:hypothetical protein
MTFALLLLLIQQDDIVYIKRATREESKQASVEATIKNLPALKQSAWKILEGAKGGKVFSSTGEIDLKAEFNGANNTKIYWQDGSAYKDEQNHAVKNPMWLYRTVEVDRDLCATVTIESAAFFSLYINGNNAQMIVNTHYLPGNRADFGVQFKKGVNHLVLQLTGATPFYWRLSGLSPELMANLEAKLDVDFPGLSEQIYYRLETIPTPKDAVLEVGGLDFMPDGRLMLCTRRGEVWSVKDGRWKRFAFGLHEALGLACTGPNEITVIQRPELTRIVDTDGDGAADVFETVCEGWNISGGSHEFLFGLPRDKDGNFYGSMCALGGGNAKYLGWCFKMTPRGDFIPWASGFRCPNGVGINGEGEVFVTDNQGDWVGTGPLYHVVKGGFYGHPTSLNWDPAFEGKRTVEDLDKHRRRAAVLFPHGIMGQSTAQPVCDLTGGKFGPFAGQMFVGDQSACTVMRVFLEKVGGEYQGACFPFRRGFQCGCNREVFGPDDSLYVGQTDRGWGAVGGRPFGLQRLVWTGKVPMEIYSMSVTPEGFELTFTKAVDPATARDAAAYSMQHYAYKYHPTYGSPQIDNTPVKVKEVRVSSDGRRVSLILPELVPLKLYELHVRGLRAADGSELLHPAAYYTLNRLRESQEHVLHTFKKNQLTKTFYCESSALADVNHDGKVDVIAGPYWYEGPDYTQKHEIYTPKEFDPLKGYSDSFLSFPIDMNGDGWTDILVVGFPGQEARWYENPKGKDEPWPMHPFFKGVDDESPQLTELNGKPVLLCGHGGCLGYVTLDGNFHAISPKSNFGPYTHGLGIGDINGDGRADILEKSGWWEQPADLTGDPAWKYHRANFGTGGAQMYAYDVNGDGLADVVTSLDAHGYGLAWYEQVREGDEITFKKHVIMGKKPEDCPYGVRFTQLHAVALVDVDGDGVKDIITGKRKWAHMQGDPEIDQPSVLYWFRTVRTKDGVEFVPYKIDDASGVGLHITIGDLNGDGRPDIVVGNKLGAFVFTHETRSVSREEWEQAQPKRRSDDRDY